MVILVLEWVGLDASAEHESIGHVHQGREVGVAAAFTHPGWRSVLGVGLAAAAALVVALALIAPRSRVRLGRAADAIDGACLVAVLPLAVAATGVF